MTSYNASINLPVKVLQRQYFAQIVSEGDHHDDTTVVTLEHIGMESAIAMRKFGYKGHIKCIQNDIDVCIEQERTCDALEDCKIRVINNDLICDHERKAEMWLSKRTVKGWNVDSVSFYEIADKFLKNLSTNPQLYICEDTMIAITFLAVPNALQLTRLKKSDKEMNEIMSIPGLTIDEKAQYLVRRFSLSLESLMSNCPHLRCLTLPAFPAGMEERCILVRNNGNTSLVLYGSENGRRNDYLMGTFYVRLSHPINCAHQTIALPPFLPLSSTESDDLLTSGPHLKFRNVIFGSTPEDCRIDIDFKFPVVPYQHREFAPVIYYLVYRLMTEDMSIGKSSGMIIRYPLLDVPFYVRCARVILYKLMQSMKTGLAVACIWIEIFMFGNLCFYATRNTGCRTTAIPGFRAKGIASINDLIRRYILDNEDDISTQIHKMYGNAEYPIRSLTLHCKTDDEIKWGDDGIRVSRNAPDMSFEKIAKRATTFENVRNSMNTVIVFPTNREGIRLIKTNLSIIEAENAVIFWDEFDEYVSSFNKDKTMTERSITCTDDANTISQKKRIWDVGMNESYFYDDADSTDSIDEEDIQFVKCLDDLCIRIYYVTATMSPIIWSSQPQSRFHIVEMKTDKKYIGYNLFPENPDHCINKIFHVPIDHVSVKRKKNPEFAKEEFMFFEAENFDKIKDFWDNNPNHDNGALIVSQYSTDRIKKQEISAEAIMEHPIAEDPLLVVVNNGYFTRIYFSHHFEDVFEMAHLQMRFNTYVSDLGLRMEYSVFKHSHRDELSNGYINITNQFVLVDHHGVRYGRRYPAIGLQLCQFLFSLLTVETRSRILILETLAMAAREKTYANFDRTFFVQTLYLNFNHSKWTNMTQYTQVYGRVCSVSPDCNLDKTRRCMTTQKLYESFIAYMRKQKAYVELWKRYPGSTVEEIDAENATGGDSEWDRIMRELMEQKFGAEMKKGHQLEVLERCKNLNGYERVKPRQSLYTVEEIVVEFVGTHGKPLRSKEIVDHFWENDLYYNEETLLTIGGRQLSEEDIDKRFYPTTQTNKKNLSRDISNKFKRRSYVLDYRSISTKVYIGLTCWSDSVWDQVKITSVDTPATGDSQKLPPVEYQQAFESCLREAAALVTDDMTLEEKFKKWVQIEWRGNGFTENDNHWKVICYIFCRDGTVDFETANTLDITDSTDFKSCFGIVQSTFVLNTSRYRVGSNAGGGSWRNKVAQGRHLRVEKQKGKPKNWYLAWH